MSDSKPTELYEGEIILACHETCKRIAAKSGLQYGNSEGVSDVYLERMAEAMILALQNCNVATEVVVIRKQK